MHIAMIISAPLPPKEGIGFYAWNLARCLVRQGHRVSIITRGAGTPTTREWVEGIEIWQPTFLPLYPLHVHLHSLFVNRVVAALDSSVDIWHVHTPLPPVPKTRKPILVTVHTPMKADTSSIPIKDAYSLAIRLQAAVSVKLERTLFARATKLATVSNSVADELREYGIERECVAVMGNGADTNLFYPDATQPEENTPYFLTAGRLAPRKGLHDLLACAHMVLQKYPAYQFLVAGSGPLEGELREQIQQLGLSNQVALIGHVHDRAKMAGLYRGATAYIHPAHYEGLPTVLLEAMACGRPVISTAVSGALDVLQNDVNGLLVPAHQPKRMAEAIFTLIETPGMRERLGAAAWDTIRQHYSWEAISRKYLAQYTNLTSGGAN